MQGQGQHRGLGRCECQFDLLKATSQVKLDLPEGRLKQVMMGKGSHAEGFAQLAPEHGLSMVHGGGAPVLIVARVLVVARAIVGGKVKVAGKEATILTGGGAAPVTVTALTAVDRPTSSAQAVANGHCPMNKSPPPPSKGFRWAHRTPFLPP